MRLMSSFTRGHVAIAYHNSCEKTKGTTDFLFLNYAQSGSTALLVPGLKGYSEVVKLLLGAGARDIPNKVDQLMDTLRRTSHSLSL